MSTSFAGDYTILRVLTRALLPWGMVSLPAIDVEKLKADMTACVERTSGRDFSKKVTGDKNPDFYRNFMNDGQDKRLTAEVFIGIAHALDRSPLDYIVGMEPALTLPSATVLTSTFAMLLDSLGVDPYEDERAQKLAANFPNALKSIAALHAQPSGDQDQLPGEVAPGAAEDRPSA